MSEKKGESGLSPPESVRITRHALDQYRSRVGGRDLSFIDLSKLIRRDVSAAFRAGRLASRQPRWTLVEPGARRAKASPHTGAHARFAWPLDERCAYLLARNRVKGVQRWTVITIYGRKTAR